MNIKDAKLRPESKLRPKPSDETGACRSQIDSNRCPKSNKAKKTGSVANIYRCLFSCYGPQHWWPAGTRFEMIVGAILTQNTAWSNVEKAISSLRSSGTLCFEGITAVPEKKLARLIRPAGYFRVKAKRLKNFVNFIAKEFHGNLNRLFALPRGVLRETLLSINGVGPETADSIALYAGKKPLFVIDAYTLRIFSRLGHLPDHASYAQAQTYLTSHLPKSVRLFNEYHALLVALAKQHCRKKPICHGCPLGCICQKNQLLSCSVKNSRDRV